MFGWIDLKVDEAVQELNDLHFQVINLDSSTVYDFSLKRELTSAGVWKHLNLKESLLRHKFKALWLKEGDRNSSYYLKVMKERFRRNFIWFVNTS